jgi:CRP-like cAMP-binding protein
MEIHILSWVKDFDNPQTFKTGETIFTEGTPGTQMFVVLEGKVDIQTGGNSLDVAGVGDIIGEMALIDASSRSATAIALEDCKLVPVDEKQFLYMVEHTPYFSLYVMKVLVERLRRKDATS